MNVQSPPKMSFDEFMRWGQHQDRKYELVRGVPVMLPWVRLKHSRIVMALVQTIGPQLKGTAFELADAEFALRTGDDSSRFADLLVIPAGLSGDTPHIDDAIVVVEVLSPSTQHNDFGPKREEYLGLKSLDTYLIFSADEPRVWQWTRNEDGAFEIEPIILEDRAATIALARLGVTIPLADIYSDPKGVRSDA
ncbi:Uma2 family endonuclease [Roseitalea porphyridii]|uniref:Uma2 family endonuclease n=1 Tax=Roseitalea porphyridii TaxID=1852022 RepID=A0A4P6UZG2_9HYPH|nr:Uma2 family endonuclease [Roseitalea porphyridii]QBK30451.1 Uma2 family endonuclease [Roseitalea porphyridii]